MIDAQTFSDRHVGNRRVVARGFPNEKASSLRGTEGAGSPCGMGGRALVDFLHFSHNTTQLHSLMVRMVRRDAFGFNKTSSNLL